jgi:hypothetical protein
MIENVQTPRKNSQVGVLTALTIRNNASMDARQELTLAAVG